MKIDQLICLCAAIALPQLVMAESQFNNQTFGTTQAIFDFCAEINGVSPTKYQDQVRLLFSDTSEQGFDKSKNTGDYKKAYLQTRTSLGLIPQNDAVLACKGFQKSDGGNTSRREFDAFQDKHGDGIDLSARRID